MNPTLTQILADADGIIVADDAAGLKRFLRMEKMAETDTTFLYTLSQWGTEFWVHRGRRSQGCVAYFLGQRDLGASFRSRVEISETEQDEILS